MIDVNDVELFARELLKLRDVGYSVQPLRCVHVRNRHATCSKCASACVTGAIAITSRGFGVSADACVGCGACAHACPTSAIEKPSECRESAQNTICDQSKHVCEWDSSNESESFELSHVDATGVLAQSVPSKREALLSHIESDGKAACEIEPSWGSLKVDVSLCRSCRMCTVFCPTGALTRYEAQGEKGLQHQPSRCVSCRLCEDICPAGAISIHRGVDAQSLRRAMAVRIPLPAPQWRPGGINQSRDRMRMLLNSPVE